MLALINDYGPKIKHITLQNGDIGEISEIINFNRKLTEDLNFKLFNIFNFTESRKIKKTLSDKKN